MSCNKATVKLIRSYLTSLNTPKALAVWIMFENNEHDQLLSLQINANDYLDPEAFRLDYLAVKFLSKATFLSTKIDKYKVAMNGFYAAELSCRKINLEKFRSSNLTIRNFAWLNDSIKRKIDSILHDFSGDELCDLSNWGPGVSTDKKISRDTSTTNKFRHEGGITRDARDFVSGFFATAYPNWNPVMVNNIGNKVVTVPKNSKTDRTIAIEPGLNLWFQKGIGSMIRRRLRRVGIDLNSQSRNQKLAFSSSLDGNLATVDFSAASDSISISTVQELLPDRWFTLMNQFRSLYGSVKDGSPFRYEKFSSMGNGFTFELESLIFFAIASCVTSYLHEKNSDVSVYGDDVILPVRCFNLFQKVCELYGFTVNTEKSFSSGWFRESCGEHYFRGLDCKPYFLRSMIKNENDIYLCANTIRRLSHSGGDYFPHCDKRFEKCWRFLYDLVKRPCLISNGYGDGGFIVNFDESNASRAKHGIEGYFCFSLITVPLGYFSDDHALLLARLKGRSVDIGLGNETYIRNRVKQFRKKLFIRRWANLGSWF